MHEYELRPRKDKHGFDLIPDVLLFSRRWYTARDDGVDHAKFFSRSHDAVVRVCDKVLSRSLSSCTVLRSFRKWLISQLV